MGQGEKKVGQRFHGERPEKGNETERELFSQFRLSLEAAGVRSVSAYMGSLAAFGRFCAEEGVAILAVGSRELDSWRSMLLVEGSSHATVNNSMNRIKRFYRWAWRRHLVARDPFEGFKGLSTGTSLPKTILSVAEMGAFLERFALRCERDYMFLSIVEFLYGSALRISEVEALRLGDIDFDSGIILVHEKKTATERKTPASHASLKAVKRYMEIAWRSCTTEAERESGFLFPQRGSTTLRCLLNVKLSRECRRLGLKRITSHSFRHSCATHLLQSGAGIRSVQAFLGHASIGSTERYTHVVTEDLKAVIESCHPRETSA
jgi:integrase/recombinase XerC